MSSESKTLLFGLLKATNAVLNSTSEEEGFSRALKILGEATKVDRVYICRHFVEQSTLETYFSLLYEWVSPFAENQLGSIGFEKVSYSRFSLLNFYENLSKGHTLKFLLKDVPVELRKAFLDEKIKSIIILPIMVGGKYWGFLGFDEINNDRIWTEEEEAILTKMALHFSFIFEELNKEKSYISNDENLNTSIIDEESIFSLFDIQNAPGFDFFINLLDLYLRDIPLLVKKIDSAVEQKDAAQLKFFTHKLGGSLLNLGAQSVISVCHQIEQAAKDNAIDEKVIELNNHLQQLVTKVLTEIESLRKKYVKFV